MEIFFWIFILIISLIVLIKSSDYFIEGAERLGLYFNIQPFVIGVFILGFGTSIPELVISITSVFKNTSEIVIANVLGSNITNIFLILGISAIIVKKSKINFDFIEFDLPLFITSVFLISITIWDGIFTRTNAMYFLLIFVIYIIYTLTNHHKKRKLIPEKLKNIQKENLSSSPKEFRYNFKILPLKIYKLIKKVNKRINWITISKIIISPVFIYFGATYIVESIIHLSNFFNIGNDIIAASVISLGTSLPEFSVSFAAIKKGKIDEMLGNILGSNIFNILLVTSIPALITKLTITPEMVSTVLPFMIIASIICFAVIYDKKITRWEGILLIFFYILYIGSIFNIL